MYDCFGAGQRLSAPVLAGPGPRSPADDAEAARALADAFGVLRILHELLSYLTEVLALTPARSDLADARERTEQLAAGDAATLATLDVASHRRAVADLLRAASAALRAEGGRPGRELPGAQLIGADLRGVDLRRADLAGALLIGADLRHVDLRGADLIGADLRGADLRGADLTGVLFATESQLLAARGDAATRLPDGLSCPQHWATGTAKPDRSRRRSSPRPRTR